MYREDYVSSLDVEASLLDNSHIDTVETLIDLESQELERLQRLDLDFGPKLRKKDLKEVFEQVKSEVHTLLDVDRDDCKLEVINPYRFDSITPGLIAAATAVCGTACYYKGEGLLPVIIAGGLGLGIAAIDKFIDIRETKHSPRYLLFTNQIKMRAGTERVKAIVSLAHEYAHHIQSHNDVHMDYFCDDIIEGHARGVERSIALVHAEAEDNPAFLYGITERTVSELRAAYKWMCNELNLSPRESLFRVKSSDDEIDIAALDNCGVPTPHSVGNTLFRIYDARHGDNIYKFMLEKRTPAALLS
jgi:hypothetical protein